MQEDTHIGKALTTEQTEWDDAWTRWESHKEDNFIDAIKRGMEGKNVGLNNGSKLLSRFTHGTHRGRYYLIGADSGVGKTTLADFMFIYHLWMAARAAGKRLFILYFSFELSKTDKKAKWVCTWIKHKFNVDLTTDYILGRIEGKVLTPEHYKMVIQAYGIVEQMMLDIQMYDTPLSATGILNRTLAHYATIGSVIREAVSTGQSEGSIIGYKPNDPEDITVVMVDHMALISEEAGAINTKQSIDRASMYFVYLRNIFNCIIVAIQQFSTSLQSAQRENNKQKDDHDIAPQRLDFGDSKYTFRDADYVFALIRPARFNRKTYFGYNLEGAVAAYFVALHLIKNRYGPDGRMIPLFANYLSGMLYDIPSAIDYTALEYCEQEALRLNDVSKDLSNF